ncbi:hypothetical protein [Sediminivirga luteola]|uniref:Uncharacterized protein n=1 Tax=Sediminivirga luteola TaxID=1774748 RepID=A0A8J2TX71_9MICO|nr:hypothetical protein [Sediminivirga luteola]GGA10636.1 hypothetical protein GCM10011333_11800 [Sediminivirga luteola]
MSQDGTRLSTKLFTTGGLLAAVGVALSLLDGRATGTAVLLWAPAVVTLIGAVIALVLEKLGYQFPESTRRPAGGLLLAGVLAVVVGVSILVFGQAVGAALLFGVIGVVMIVGAQVIRSRHSSGNR